MLAALVVLNLLCLAGLVAVFGRLLHPAPRGDAGESFARVLAAAAPLAPHLLASEGGPDGGEPPPLPTATRE